MTKLYVVNRNGDHADYPASPGMSVMEIIRDNGGDELLALCGGSCSCATCHVYVDKAWVSAVGAPSADEGELLQSSDHCTSASRLSCQIRFTAAMDGMTVTIAPED